MASLFGKNRRTASKNTKADGTPQDLTSGGRETPYRTKERSPGNIPRFVNATATPINHDFITAALNHVSTTKIKGTEHPTINNGKFAPMFLGYPGSPDPDFLFSSPNVSADSFFLSSEQKCEEVAIFANLHCGLREKRKNKLACRTSSLDRRPGYFLPALTEDPVTPTGGLEANQTNQPGATLYPVPTGSVGEIIKVHHLSIRFEDCRFRSRVSPFVNVPNGTLVGNRDILQNLPASPYKNIFLPDVEHIDTWYDGDWIDYKADNYNVGVGATSVMDVSGNPKYKPGERYAWSFGTVFLFKRIGVPKQLPSRVCVQELEIYKDNPFGALSELTCDSITVGEVEEDETFDGKVLSCPNSEGEFDVIPYRDTEWPPDPPTDIIIPRGETGETDDIIELYRDILRYPSVIFDYSNECEIEIKTWLYECESVDTEGESVLVREEQKYEGVYGRFIKTCFFGCLNAGNCVKIEDTGSALIIGFDADTCGCCPTSSSSTSTSDSSTSSSSDDESSSDYIYTVEGFEGMSGDAI